MAEALAELEHLDNYDFDAEDDASLEEEDAKPLKKPLSETLNLDDPGRHRNHF